MKTAYVEIFSQALGSYDPLPEAEVFSLEKNKSLGLTDQQGKLSFQYPVGEQITLMFKKSGYKTSQSATFVVPEDGFVGQYKNITYQAISSSLYKILKNLIAVYKVTSLDKNSFQILATVTAYHKTIEDAPQGITGSSLHIFQNDKEIFDQYKKYYFGEILGKTLPVPFLTKTSKDGGAILINVKDDAITPYTIKAKNTDVNFSEQTVICNREWWDLLAHNEDPFINLSPPHGSTQLEKN
jgi:hypothetical protein